jgi:hypothetical protein
MYQTITTVQATQFLGFGKNITFFVIEQSIINENRYRQDIYELRVLWFDEILNWSADPTVNNTVFLL